MTVLYLSLAWVVGMVAAAFLLAPPVIILAFGIPFTFEMKRRGILTSAAPVSRYLVSFVFLLGLFALVSWGMCHFFPQYIWGYVIGVGITLVPSLGKCGRTQNNIIEFFETNAERVDKAAFSRWAQAKDASDVNH